ncbi:MAG TPA: chemotaxis response regulator protein-glutamate methylesterase [Rhodocyclaceae bacterium]|nr:chemotaxis response regulator protein-glutamate methylesterase [Rhodocyclaceae bacterium]
MKATIKVLIVDDSAVVRQVAREILDADPDIQVVGAAADPVFAVERMKRNWPDVLVLGIEAPRMDGLAFLKKLMAESPLPVVVCSTPGADGSDVGRQALAAGAVSVISKPRMGLKDFLKNASGELVAAVKTAAGAGLGTPAKRPPPADSLSARDGRLQGAVKPAEAVVAIGTSTGGTQALEAVLTALPAACPGIVIVQHMPERFTALFAERLDALCQVEVREARNGDRVLAGQALVAPGGRHMTLHRSGGHYQVEVADGPPVNRHKPSVDVLFRSVAKVAGGNALGVIMTGMGDDGALGLKEMHDAGARTVAEDEASCVVFGMPKEAIKLGGVDRVVPLQQIAKEILAFGRDQQQAS